MADPNASPVGDSAGTLSAPDMGATQTGISDIESALDPKIEQSREREQSLSEESIKATLEQSDYAQKAAGEESAEDEEMQHWLDHTPTRQAIYSTGMHGATFLSIMTALGGKLTRLNGQQMLAAQTGIVQGFNEANEQKYNEAMAAWQGAYEKMRQHQEKLREAHRLMLTSYQGRADAYQKATEAARRMTGDLLDDKQKQIQTKVDLYKAQSTAWDKLQRVDLANRELARRAARDLQQEAHWKEVAQKSSQMPAEVKAQIAAEKQRWQNARAQKDEILRQRGQVSSRLDLSDDVKNGMLQRYDDQLQALDMEMDRAQSNTDAIVSGFLATKTTPGRPPAGPPPGPGGGGGGSGAGSWGGDTSQLPPAALQTLKTHIGKPVKFTNGQTWVMEQDGTTHRVQ